MGKIKEDVWDQHLYSFIEEEEYLKLFLNGFNVTYGRRRKAFNTELSVYFLQPESFMAETYGFNQEILLVYSPFTSIEPRTIQSIEAYLNEIPAKGRVERLSYFVISQDKSVREWVNNYTSTNQESRIIIAFSVDELKSNKTDDWYIRNVLNKQLYNRDLFDYRLPLEKDTYFFGREDIVASFSDAVKRSENRGLFGLRKTGKTSTLFKLERTLKAEDSIHFLYFDCKSPSIRKLRWFELLELVSKELSVSSGVSVKAKYDEVSIAGTFMKLVSELPKPAVLVFDEIEYISPIALKDKHWEDDFVDFWQTFWACQSRHRKISTIIAGVNPGVVEMDTIKGIQNPLFGIVSDQFLKGLGLDETNRMLRTLGKRMGLQFKQDAVQYIQQRYGGHPLLTRIACSLINSNVKFADERRPVEITKARLLHEEDTRDSDLTFYCRHVVSELLQFYPDEYEMLELLASRQISDFLDLATHQEYIKHLQSYGLLAFDQSGIPMIPIPVLERYIGLEYARRENRRTIYKVVSPELRETWKQKRISHVLHDIRFLEKLILNQGLPSLFGPNSLPEADSFVRTKVCETESDFADFINICNRCFVESIEVYGRSIGQTNYYWNDIKGTYPGLWSALQRVKLYRHNHMHLKLTTQVNAELLNYLNRDLEGSKPSQVPDIFFVLQQCVLDGMLTGIQIELNKLT